MLCELRALRDYRQVEVAEPEPRALHAANDLRKQLHAVRALVLRVAVREKLPDVAHRECAEYRVHQGVHRDVRVRVTEKSKFAGYLHAAQNELPLRNQAVYVVACANSYHVKSLLYINDNAQARFCQQCGSKK